MTKSDIDKIYESSFVLIDDELFNECHVFDKYLFARQIAGHVALEIAAADLKRKEVGDVDPV